MALLINSRFDVRLSDIQWDGDDSYPHSTGCYGSTSKVFPPTSSRPGGTRGIRRTGLNSLTGSSVPPQLQRLPAGKNSFGGVVVSNASRFEDSKPI